MGRENKGFRLLKLYNRLNKGEMLIKSKLAKEFNASEKSIQRDIDDLRAFLTENHYDEQDIEIKYNRAKGGYILIRSDREWLSNEEIMALAKILLESRAFSKEETEQLLGKLMLQAAPEDRTAIKDMIVNERFYYVPLTNAKPMLQSIWSIGEYIRKQQIIKFDYVRQDKKRVKHTVKPVGIIFSEYYFYLIAYLADGSKDFPTVFRLDRVENAKPTGEKFYIPYKDKFNDGEFRKRVQFMYPGELTKVRFNFWGASLDAVLDRLPTAMVVQQEDGKALVEAEVFGNGIKMWLFSQMEFLEVISPAVLREEMQKTAKKIAQSYGV